MWVDVGDVGERFSATEWMLQDTVLMGGGSVWMSLSGGSESGERTRRRSALRLLLVDDDVDFLLEMKRRLEELGRDIVAAQTPVQAIWILERERIDAVVCDLRLGNADGRHLLEIVRERWPRVARVLITGFGDEILDGETWPAAQAVVFKPCDAERLAALLSELPDDAGVPSDN